LGAVPLERAKRLRVTGRILAGHFDPKFTAEPAIGKSAGENYRNQVENGGNPGRFCRIEGDKALKDA
jgi:hypothetical protein